MFPCIEKRGFKSRRLSKNSKAQTIPFGQGTPALWMDDIDAAMLVCRSNHDFSGSLEGRPIDVLPRIYQSLKQTAGFTRIESTTKM